MEDKVIKNNSELWGLSIKDIFFKYLRFLPVVILSVILAMAGGFLYLRYTTQIYSSTGVLLIQTKNEARSSDRVEDLLSNSGKIQNIQNEIEILKSRPLMSRVVKSLGLTFTITAKGNIKDQNVYKSGPFEITGTSITDSLAGFALSVKYEDSANISVNGTRVPFGQEVKNRYGSFIFKSRFPAAAGSEYIVSWTPVKGVASYLAGTIAVQPKTANSAILALSMTGTNALLTADVVNTLMDEYNEMNIEQNNYSTDQMIEFIDSRLVILNKELDTSQQRLLVYQQQNDLVDIDMQSANFFSRINESDKAILTEQTRLSIAEIIQGYLTDKENYYEKVVVPSSLGLDDPVLNGMVAEYNRLQMERKALIESNTPSGNPAVKELEARVESVRESILENIKNIKASYNATIGRLKTSSAASQVNLSALPYKIKEFVELKRQVDIKMELVKQLEGKVEEAAIRRASAISDSKIIEEANVGGQVKPNAGFVQLLAFLIGIGIPVVIIFVREILDDKINDRNDIEKITSAPVVGEIGHSFNKDVLVVGAGSRSMVSEQFRIVRSNLQYIIGKVERPVIMVTSSFSGEGKSFISTNMGAVMAVAGKKTVVLEFDIRKPKVLSGLKMSKHPGISNHLTGKGELKDLIIPVPDVENLFVLPCGPVPPNPAELLLDPNVKEMFTYLRNNFDVVIIDTAPVGMVSDAVALGEFADCTLYLVRQGYTFKRQIALIEELYQQKKLPAVSVIVNDVKVKSGYGYYGYGRYRRSYYGYGQGNTYYEDDQPPTVGMKLWNRIASANPFKKRGK